MAGYITVIVIATVSRLLLSLELRYIYRRLWTARRGRFIVGALFSCYLFALVVARDHQFGVPAVAPATR